MVNCAVAKSRDYKERQVERKKRKVCVTRHVVLHMAAIFLASALNRGSHSSQILKMTTITGGGEHGAHDESLMNYLTLF